MTWTIRTGDCRTLMGELADESVDVIITDPPYEIGQTQAPGVHWDERGVAFDPSVWRECLRVLKPGGHLAAFGATKTFHRLATAIEDAGFTIRDQLAWIYTSGMVKGLAFDRVFARTGRPDLAREYAGTRSRLKPAFEPVCLAAKPFPGPMPDGVARWGTGTLQVDACRIPTDDDLTRRPGRSTGVLPIADRTEPNHPDPGGRYPSNLVIVDDDEGTCSRAVDNLVITGRRRIVSDKLPKVIDRVFYSAKASQRERPVVDGVGHLTVKPVAVMRWLTSLLVRPGQTVLDPFCGSGPTLQAAVELGADAIGFDIDPHSVALTVTRMRQAGLPQTDPRHPGDHVDNLPLDGINRGQAM